MSLTLPNLDDRRYDDLVEEARGLLVTYAPALTNHNPSDPAVTLLELFAYLTEILLFRVNTVTDASRTAFLRLLNGPTWKAPKTAAELDAEIRRTVLMLRTPDRAVGPADFEFLSRAADARVARAHCVPERNLAATDPVQRTGVARGHVSVVVIPNTDAPLTTVLSQVAAYLEPRRLLATHVHVVGPRFVSMRVRVTLRLLPEGRDTTVHDAAVTALTTFFAPIAGDGHDGWPLGRDVFISEIYSLLDSLPGVDYVRRTLDGGGQPLDEVVVSDSGRLLRNGANELISVALDADELVQLNFVAADIVTEIPESAV